jgi:hypothetical protein
MKKMYQPPECAYIIVGSSLFLIHYARGSAEAESGVYLVPDGIVSVTWHHCKSLESGNFVQRLQFVISLRATAR